MVYMTVGRLIPELRVNDQNGGVREQQMEGYAGDYLASSGLRELIEGVGGMVRNGCGHH